MSNNTGFLGFESTTDFYQSLFGVKNWAFNVAVGIVGSLTTFILKYMWDDEKAVYTLWIMMLLDWSTGVLKGIITKRFVSFKIFRMPLYFLATSLVISLSWWMAKGNLIFLPLPGLVMGGFYSVYFVSLLENMGEIGLLPKPIVRALKNRFGFKTIIAKYSKEQEIKEDKDGEE